MMNLIILLSAGGYAYFGGWLISVAISITFGVLPIIEKTRTPGLFLGSFAIGFMTYDFWSHTIPLLLQLESSNASIFGFILLETLLLGSVTFKTFKMF